jgi:hypothetical protein
MTEGDIARNCAYFSLSSVTTCRSSFRNFKCISNGECFSRKNSKQEITLGKPTQRKGCSYRHQSFLIMKLIQTLKVLGSSARSRSCILSPSLHLCRRLYRPSLVMSVRKVQKSSMPRPHSSEDKCCCYCFFQAEIDDELWRTRVSDPIEGLQNLCASIHLH